MGIKENFGNPQGTIGKIMLFFMNKGHTPMAKWALTQFNIPKDGKILDVGCGGGYNVKRFLALSQAEIYGVDISETCVEKSQAVNKKLLGKRCEIYKSSADELPFDDNSINLVTAFETVYFWKNIENCFAEIFRVLTPHGRFAIINDPGNPKKNWDEIIPNMVNRKPEEFQQLMTDAGFDNINITSNKNKVCIIGEKLQ